MTNIIKTNVSTFRDGPFSWLPPSHPAVKKALLAQKPIYKAISQPKEQFSKTVITDGQIPDDFASTPYVIRGERIHNLDVLDENQSFQNYCLKPTFKNSCNFMEVLEIPPKNEFADKNCAHVDTTTSTIKISRYQEYAPFYSDEEMLEFISRDLQMAIGLKVGDPCNPQHFYSYGRRIEHISDSVHSRNLGSIWWGGNRDTICIYLTGEGCEHINMNHGFERLAKYFELLEAKITRVDFAHDDLEGEKTVDLVSDWYLEGKFNRCGKEPICDMRGDWKTGKDERGRTFYVGLRESGKQLCVYEKGKQLKSVEYPNWVRWEGRLGSKSRIIPYECLLKPGQYLAGMYPCLDWISEKKIKVKTVVKAKVESTIDSGLQNCRYQYGSFVKAAMAIGYSSDSIIDLLIKGKSPPKRLVVPTKVEDDFVPENIDKKPNFDSYDPFDMKNEFRSEFRSFDIESDNFDEYMDEYNSYIRNRKRTA